MGCDIHFFVEAKKDGKWVSQDTWEKDEDDPMRQRVVSEFYEDRNYNLFAILADVRNGRGFAGIKTGDGFLPIAEPKGLPDDASEEVSMEADAWEGDGHSHSWHTLADILAYDWTQTTKLSGLVNGPQYRDWMNWGKSRGEGPKQYCGDAWGNEIKKISPDEMEQAIKNVSIEGKTYQEISKEIEQQLNRTYCRVEWEIPYYKCATEFLGCTVPRLLRLGKPEDVRIVFWFDN